MKYLNSNLDDFAVACAEVFELCALTFAEIMAVLFQKSSHAERNYSRNLLTTNYTLCINMHFKDCLLI